MTTQSVSSSAPRTRWKSLLVGLIIIATGLFWRSRYCPLSPFFIKYGGDALWAVVVFLGFGILFVRTSTVRIALLALSFSWAIEFSQLYHAPWIDVLRDTRPGALILGSTFNPPDLLAYAIGIALGSMTELIFARLPEIKRKRA